ncbi:MAG: DUF6691 family protein [Myxococcota bacterium]
MKGVITALLSGILYAFGLVLSGMLIPEKVIGFLDVFGNWDPTLGFVMGGAIGVHLPLRRWLIARGTPDPAPKKKGIDARLVLGSLLFGAGWGLSGYCPGPALVALGTREQSVALFVAAMIIGMWMYRFSLGRTSP